jgi:distribution and morphology protein 34
MAFIFNWPQFSEETLSLAKLSLAEAINSGEKPDNVVGEIVVSDVNFGVIPPYLELLEICEISINRFRGLFKVQYDGDFHLELTLK